MARRIRDGQKPRGLKFWKRKNKANENSPSTPDRRQLVNRKEKSRGIISQASTAKVNNVTDDDSYAGSDSKALVKAGLGISNLEATKREFTKTHSLMDDVSIDNSLTQDDDEEDLRFAQLLPSLGDQKNNGNLPSSPPASTKLPKHQCAYQHNYSSTLPAISSTPKKESSSSPLSKDSESNSPSKWKDSQYAKNKKCIAKLHELAREHNGAGNQALSPNEKILQQRIQKQLETPRRNNVDKNIERQVLGSPSPAAAAAAAASSSPTSVLNFTSLRTGMEKIANTSMASLFQCTSTLKDVECNTVITDFKDDVYYTYNDLLANTKRNNNENDADSNEFNQEEDEEEKSDGSDSILNQEDECNSYLADVDNGEKGNGSTSSQDSSAIFDESMLNGSSQMTNTVLGSRASLNPLTRHTPQPRRNKALDKSTGSIPLKQKSNCTLTERNSANPSTSNIPWDERSVSSKSNKVAHPKELQFVSLKDVN